MAENAGTQEILRRLRALGSERARAGMARYGINVANAFGVSIEKLRPVARQVGRDHALAGALWATGVHEARLLAAFIDEPAKVTESQMDRWARDFDSWDLCDQVVSKLFDRTPFAWRKAVAWARRAGPGDEFVRRAGFAMMAALAVHGKDAPDVAFAGFLAEIQRAATDERNFVKKAVNWALRQIGKRSAGLNAKAAAAARRIARLDSRAATWIAKDALRELRSDRVLKKLGIASAKKERWG